MSEEHIVLGAVLSQYIPEAPLARSPAMVGASPIDEAVATAMSFAEGQRIRITDGPFTEFVGVIVEVDRHAGEIVALVQMFGRDTPVRVSFQQVEKL